jgi:hypothetical protein
MVMMMGDENGDDSVSVSKANANPNPATPPLCCFSEQLPFHKHHITSLTHNLSAPSITTDLSQSITPSLPLSSHLIRKSLMGYLDSWNANNQIFAPPSFLITFQPRKIGLF